MTPEEDERIRNASTESLKQTLEDEIALFPRYMGIERGTKWASDFQNRVFLDRLAAAVQASGGREPGTGDAADFVKLLPFPVTLDAWRLLARIAGKGCVAETYGVLEEDFDDQGQLDPDAADGQGHGLFNDATRKDYVMGFLQGAMEVWHTA